MLRNLFARLTPPPAGKLYDAIVSEAREPHWFIEGEVPDTIDGRFAILATLLAIVLVRLESEDAELSVTLTERFIEVMESEHRELGLGDPKLGRTVRKLVGSLSRRVDIWRSAIGGQASWQDSAEESIYKSAQSADALSHTADRLRSFSSGLVKVDAAALAEGRIK